MRKITTARAMSGAARKLIRAGKTIALVPTMGFLHEGHLSLVKRARKSVDVVVVSIFVNPAQFGPSEDFKNYPREISRDLKLLSEVDVEIVFMPPVSEIYPKGHQTHVIVEEITDTLEGQARPGHFRGVTTIVAKLFNICRPDLVVFGQKDFQQARVLEKMSRDLGYPIKFVIAPTRRESDGLAMSSRNAYFSPDQRAEANCLYQGLKAARRAFKSGETRPGALTKIARSEAQKVCPGAAFDYIALTDQTSLQPLKVAKKGAVLSVAAKVHGVRLIDNLIF